MLFPTYTFFVFFVAIFGLYWYLKRFPLAWRLFLLAISYFFYAVWDMRFLAVLGGVTLWSFFLVRGRERLRNSWARSWLLGIAIAGNLCTLAVFKYYDFFRVSFENFVGLLGLSVSGPVLDLLLPVGLSFYVLRAISYVADSARGKIPHASFIDFAIYLSFFPQLLSGPIARPGDFLPQLADGGAKEIDRPHEYFGLILVGLLKKVVIASHVASLIDPVFAVPQAYGGLDMLLAVYGYAILIYCDFSGYSDMAIGIAGLLGFRSPLNFDRPYFALSIQEFWRRWHISFSEWLRDYVYIPLGGNRKGSARQAANGFITMLVSGLWHGAGLNFIVWGALHGGALGIQRAWKGVNERLGWSNAATRFLAWVCTFHFVVLAWIVFRSQTLADIASVFHSFLAPVPLHGAFTLTAGCAAIAAFIFFRFEAHLIRAYAAVQHSMPMYLQPLLFGAIIIGIIELGPAIVPPFIYFQF